MNSYNPDMFISAITHKIGQDFICPYCKGKSFTTTEYFASILINKKISEINIGPSIPSGMLICRNCGHVDFFALAPLRLVQNVEVKNEQ